MDPETVAGLQIGNLRDGQSGSRSLHVNLDLGSSEVEGGILGVRGRGKQ